jgi:hypothetical protein
MPWIFWKIWEAQAKAQPNEIELHETGELAHSASCLGSLNSWLFRQQRQLGT